MKLQKHHIIGGGTIFHVRPHTALAAFARGTTAHRLGALLSDACPEAEVHKHLTKMAGGPTLETNEDIKGLIDTLIADESTKIIMLPAALCDFEGYVQVKGALTPSGKDQPRLQTSEGDQQLVLRPAEKIIKRVRATRKDIFLVGFKTTAGASPDEQFNAGLKLLKESSCNLVLANDVHTRLNMVVTPEEARYHETSDREAALQGLVEMAVHRSRGTFTRSTIVPGDAVPWSSELIPESLRKVVNFCIAQKAYKPFLGSTVGHFAVRIGANRFLTSRRKSDFNKLDEIGLVLIESDGPDSVIAHGSRPSVGGQSQRIVFNDHPDLDCIVHAHVPLRADARDIVPLREQWPHECGSHECGRNTSQGLRQFGNVWAVMLDRHGPNIVFNRNTDPNEVIDFITANFNLAGSTRGVRGITQARNEEQQLEAR